MITIENPDVQQDDVVRFLQIDKLEKQLDALNKRVNGLYEMVERIIQVNVLLKRNELPAVTSGSGSTVEQQQQTVDASPSPSVQQIQILKSEGNLFLKGKTFDLKEQLKAQFGARWDTSMKMWVINDASETLEESVRDFLSKNGRS
jgi:hypothetical protein